MVDAQWLSRIRAKNRARFGFPGNPNALSGLGYVSSQDLVDAINREREIRTASIHRGRLERRDPLRPAEGSVEAIVQAMGPIEVPPPRPIPKGVVYLGGAVALGVVGLLAFLALRGR